MVLTDREFIYFLTDFDRFKKKSLFQTVINNYAIVPENIFPSLEVCRSYAGLTSGLVMN